MAWRKLEDYPSLRIYIEKKLKQEGYTYQDREELQSTLRSFAQGRGAEGFIGFLEGSRFSPSEYAQRYKKTKRWDGLYNEENEQLSILARISNRINRLAEVKTMVELEEIENDIISAEGDVYNIFDVSDIQRKINELRDNIVTELYRDVREEIKRIQTFEDIEKINFDFLPDSPERTEIAEMLKEKGQEVESQEEYVERRLIERIDAINKEDIHALTKLRKINPNEAITSASELRVREALENKKALL